MCEMRKENNRLQNNKKKEAGGWRKSGKCQREEKEGGRIILPWSIYT